MNTDTLVLLFYSDYFWMIIYIKNVNNFQIKNIQPEGVTYHLFGFLPISAVKNGCRCLFITK